MGTPPRLARAPIVAPARSARGGRRRPDRGIATYSCSAPAAGAGARRSGACSAVPALPPPPRGPDQNLSGSGATLADLAFDAAPVALAVAGTNGRLLRVNRAFCDLLGYSREQLIGMTYEEITDPEDLHLDEEAVAGMRASGRGPAVEKRF